MNTIIVTITVTITVTIVGLLVNIIVKTQHKGILNFFNNLRDHQTQANK